MKCVIPGANLKVFARAVHSLSKIGEELYIEALVDGLALRTVNSSRSAYACFIFVPTFFTKYDGPSSTQKTADDSDVLKCKITMKSCLTVFKSLSTLEKTVEKCRLSLDLDTNRLVFQLCCKHGIVKTYNLAFIECETLQAVFSKDFSPNVLVSQSKLFHDIVGNFQSGQEEITLIVNPEKVTIKNYVDDEPDPHKVIRTELSLMPDEFENFRIGVDTDVTFCLKELRALLAFSEPANLPLSMYFESAGRPIILAIDSDPSFEASFVLATLADPGTQISSSQQSTAAAYSKGTASKNPTKSGSVSKGQPSRTRKPPSVESKARKDNTLVPGKASNRFPETPTESNSRTANTVVSDSSRAERSVNEVEDLEIGDVSMAIIESHIADRTESSRSKSSSKEHVQGISTKSSASEKLEDRAEEGSSIPINKPSNCDASPVIPIIQATSEKVLPSHSCKQQTTLLSKAREGEEDDEEDEDLVPGTPPSKKFRSLFFGLSQSTTGGSQPSLPAPVVLAEDSEED